MRVQMTEGLFLCCGPALGGGGLVSTPCLGALR